MTAGLVTVGVCVVLVLAFGGWRRYADGRFRGAGRRTPPDRVVAEPLVPAHELGERATLLQFSSAFCAPCRATRRVLGEVVDLVPGVTHVEIDAEHHLELVRRVGVLRTPTTLVLDARGQEVTRAAGAPTRDQVMHALAQVEG